MLQNYVVNSRRKTVWLALILLIFMGGGTVLPPAEARYRPTTGTDFFSRDQEIQAGQQAAADVNLKMPVLPESDPITATSSGWAVNWLRALQAKGGLTPSML